MEKEKQEQLKPACMPAYTCAFTCVQQESLQLSVSVSTEYYQGLTISMVAKWEI